MLERARAGRSVLRLKGGDPFVFGRGGEEALRLRAAGIPFEIVPGITAGVAAPAYAGIPVTHRGLASAVALVTGHTRGRAGPESAIDWPGLAAFPGTLVFYMGVRRLPEIAELADRGRARPRRGGRGGPGRDAARPAHRPRDARDDRRGVAREGIRRAVGDRRRGRRRRSASSWHGWRRDRSRAGPWPSPVRAREASEPGPEAAGARGRRARDTGDPHRGAGRGRRLTRRPMTYLRDQPERCRPDVRPPRRRPTGPMRGRWRARGSLRSAPARRGRSRPTACARTSCRERSVAEWLVEALAEVPVTRALVARAAEARDVASRRPARPRRRGGRAGAL